MHVTGGPLSTGEGLVAALDASFTGKTGQYTYKQFEAATSKKNIDKRLFVVDEEFASALTASKRKGNTLPMALRGFWDTGDCEPLVKINRISVAGAHVCIVTHITLPELKYLMEHTMINNGFCNRFLWICADRSKLLPLPRPMPEAALTPLSRELWTRVGKAQKRDELMFTGAAEGLWVDVYPQLSKEEGDPGAATSRGEAQVRRLALLYALLDGQNAVGIDHLPMPKAGERTHTV